MNKYILVVRPSFDRTTKYLSAWAEKNFKLAVEKGNTILDLKDKRAKRKEVVSMIKIFIKDFAKSMNLKYKKQPTLSI